MKKLLIILLLPTFMFGQRSFGDVNGDLMVNTIDLVHLSSNLVGVEGYNIDDTSSGKMSNWLKGKYLAETGVEREGQDDEYSYYNIFKFFPDNGYAWNEYATTDNRGWGENCYKITNYGGDDEDLEYFPENYKPRYWVFDDTENRIEFVLNSNSSNREWAFIKVDENTIAVTVHSVLSSKLIWSTPWLLKLLTQEQVDELINQKVETSIYGRCD